jgi:hypothetical protein
MGQDAETNTERQAGFAVARGDFVALAALRCRPSGAGFPRRTLNLEEREDFRWIGRTLPSFRAGGHEADGSTEAVFVCALAESGQAGFGGWARSLGRAVAIRDKSQVRSGELSASNSIRIGGARANDSELPRAPFCQPRSRLQRIKM